MSAAPVPAIALALLIALCGCAQRSVSSEPTSTRDDIASSVRGAAPADVVLSREVWEWADGAQTIRTPHYRIFTTESDARLLSATPGFLESALAHYRTALAPLPAPTTKLDAYLLDNRPQWIRLTKQLLGGDSAPFLRIQRGGYATRGVGVYFDIGPFDTLAIAAHEGWHQYRQRTFREALPSWLEEGVATYMEGHKWSGGEPIFLPWANIERFDHLRRIEAAGELLSLEELLTLTSRRNLERIGDATLAYYAQLWALMHFLREGDGSQTRAQLTAALVDAHEGRLGRTLALRLGDEIARRAIARRDGVAVFQAYFDRSVDAASRRYDRFVKALVRAGARDDIVAGRSPAARLPGVAP